MPTPPKLTLFTKLMMLTASDQDGEALSALRKANAMLAAQNMNWEELINAKVTWKETKASAGADEEYKNRTQQKARPQTDATIEEMFEKLLATVPESSSFREFIVDVHEFYEDKGFLTDGQYDAIVRSYHRATGVYG